MNVFGATTMHILHNSYLEDSTLSALDMCPSINGWYTTVSNWVSGSAALKQAASFLDTVERELKGTFGDIPEEFRVVTGAVRRFNGVLCFEKTLLVRVKTNWETVAKVDIAYGPEGAVDAWDAAERKEWFQHSMI